MADVLKTSGPITVERNTTITDVKGQKHTGLKQKTVVDANQKSLVSFSVGSTTNCKLHKRQTEKLMYHLMQVFSQLVTGKFPLLLRSATLACWK